MAHQLNKPNLRELENILNINFKNKELLLTALRHRSYLNEVKNKNLISNERLEFLGDAVLELVVTDFLYHRYQDRPEGDLTHLRASLVCTSSLAKLSRRLHLGKFLLLSKGEKLQGGNNNENILADLFEAIIGAIYLDQGYQKAAEFIKKHLLTNLPNRINLQEVKDAKSYFQEIAQKKYKVTPRYDVLEEKEKEGEDKFTVGLYLDKKLITTAQGKNKKEATEKAAQKALEKIKA